VKGNDNCTRHQGKLLELRCLECNISICMKCYAVSHQHHKCQEIEEYARELRVHVDKDIESVKSQKAKVANKLKRLNNEKSKFLRGVETTKESIRRRAEEIKKIVDKQADAMLDELRCVEAEVRSAVQKNEKELELEVQRLNSLVDSYTQFRTQSNQIDRMRFADSFHASVVEHLNYGDCLGNYRTPYIEFVAVKLDNCIGRLHIRKFPSEYQY